MPSAARSIASSRALIECCTRGRSPYHLHTFCAAPPCASCGTARQGHGLARRIGSVVRPGKPVHPVRPVFRAVTWHGLDCLAFQVHATLALAAATSAGPAGPDGHAWADAAATNRPGTDPLLRLFPPETGRATRLVPVSESSWAVHCAAAYGRPWPGGAPSLSNAGSGHHPHQPSGIAARPAWRATRPARRPDAP